MRAAPLTILWHANGHPTFLVLLDANPAPWLLDPLDFLLIENQLASAEPLGLDDLAVAMPPCKVPNLGTEVAVGAGAGAGARAAASRADKGHGAHRYLFDKIGGRGGGVRGARGAGRVRSRGRNITNDRLLLYHLGNRRGRRRRRRLHEDGGRRLLVHDHSRRRRRKWGHRGWWRGQRLDDRLLPFLHKIASFGSGAKMFELACGTRLVRVRENERIEDFWQ